MHKGRKEDDFSGDYALIGVDQVSVEAGAGRLRLVHDDSPCLSVSARLKRSAYARGEADFSPIEVERREGVLFVKIKECPAGQGGLEISLSLPRSVPLAVTLRGKARLTSRAPWAKAEVVVTDTARASFHMCGPLQLRTFHQAHASCTVHEGGGRGGRVDASATDSARVTLSGVFGKVALYASERGQIRMEGPVSKTFSVLARGRCAITHNGARRARKTRIDTDGPRARVQLEDTLEVRPQTPKKKKKPVVTPAAERPSPKPLLAPSEDYRKTVRRACVFA